MSMHLTPELLGELATIIPPLDKTGLKVKQVEFKGHDVYLTSDENGSHTIVGISRIKKPDTTPAMRTGGFR